MTKEEKKNVIIALLLCVAAVIIIWLLSGKSPVYGNTTGDTFNPADLPGAGTNYANYNIMPGTTPNVPGINIGGNTSNTGTGGCCTPPCGNPDSPNDVPYWFYRSYGP